MISPNRASRNGFSWLGIFFGVFVTPLFLCIAPQAVADTASQQAVGASTAQLNALGLPMVPTGSNVRVAVLEVANGIPELSPPNANMPTAGGGPGQINIVVGGGALTDHATTVSGTIVQRTPGGPPHAAIAPNATVIHSPGSNFYNTLTRSQSMLSSAGGGNAAGILNWSWHRTAPAIPSNGMSLENLWLDWAVIPGTAGPPVGDELIIVAGNETALDSRFSPWDNYNGITVGATARNNYRRLASYNGQAGATIGSKNITTDVSPYGNGRVGRYKTDLVGPGGGDGIVLAAPVIKNGARDLNNDGLNDTGTWGGTSFAAPHVAGASALLREFGTAQSLSRNELVIKSVLLNGASTTGLSDRLGNPYAPVGTLAQTKSNGGGAKPIYVGWDEDLGTGLLDVSRSLLQYNAGEHNPGAVPIIGWDLNKVGLSDDGALTREYVFNQIGLKTIRASLAWNRFVSLSDIAQPGFSVGHWDTEDRDLNGAWSVGDVDVDGDNNLDMETFSAMTLNDLDLELWNLTQSQRVFFSTSDMDSIEHFDWTIPPAMRNDSFSLRVTRFRQFGIADDNYGVSWWAQAVPEPGTWCLACVVGLAALGRARSRRKSF